MTPSSIHSGCRTSLRILNPNARRGNLDKSNAVHVKSGPAHLNTTAVRPRVKIVHPPFYMETHSCTPQVRDEPRRHLPVEYSQPLASIADLPNELLLEILAMLLQHHHPIYVDHNWMNASAVEFPERFGFVLHVHRLPSSHEAWKQIFSLGLPLFYSLNTFVLSLDPYRKLPGVMDHWGDGPFETGPNNDVLYEMPSPTCATHVKSIIITARHAQNWDDLEHMLRPFKQQLTTLVLDWRYFGEHKTYDGVRDDWLSQEWPQMLEYLKGIGFTALKHVSVGATNLEELTGRLGRTGHIWGFCGAEGDLIW